jgi:hypothetical protein
LVLFALNSKLMVLEMHQPLRKHRRRKKRNLPKKNLRRHLLQPLLRKQQPKLHLLQPLHQQWHLSPVRPGPKPSLALLFVSVPVKQTSASIMSQDQVLPAESATLTWTHTSLVAHQVQAAPLLSEGVLESNSTGQRP